MTKYQSDEKIAESLNKVFAEKKYQCVSNSVVMNVAKATFIMYVARDNEQQLFVVLINLTADNQSTNIRFFPIKVKNQNILQNMWFEIAPSPYLKAVFSFVAYDPKAHSKDKLVYFVPFNADQIEKIKEVQLHMIQTREHGRVKDVQWYSFAALTLTILTDIKIITFNLNIDHINPIGQIYLKDLSVAILNQTVKNDHFQQIAFSKILNHKEEYSSLGKKLTIYLISKTGQIYVLFPFICPQIIFDENEIHQFYDLKQKLFANNMALETPRKISLMQWVTKGKTRKIEKDETANFDDNEDGDGFAVEFSNVLGLKVQLFKLNPTNYSRYNDTMKASSQSVSSFTVLTFSQHTIILHSEKFANKQHQLKVQILSQQPYDRLINSNKQVNFVLQTVGEFRFGKEQSIQQRQFDTIKLITQNFMTNEFFLLHNNITCYRLSLDGLANLLSSTNSDSLSDKLIDCDVLFKSNSELVTISNNWTTIFFIRYQNNTYFFQSVPLQSIQLNEVIRNTIEETETLFKKLGNQSLPITQAGREQKQTLEFKKINEQALIEIENQLAKFNNDSKKYIESKLQRVKKLYESIISKQSLLEQQQRQKQQLIDLINKAEENDMKIKLITSQNSINLNRTERDLERRIRSLHKSLDNISKTFEQKNKLIQQDEDKRETMIQCKQQADAVINRLEETKQKLIEKRDQLRRGLLSI